MLKILFWSLLFANVVLFAYERGYLGTWISDGHEPTRMNQQFNPANIKLIPAGPIAPVAMKEQKPPVVTCTEIGNFDTAFASQFETRLSPLALGDKLSQRDVQEVALSMVFIPSQGSKEGADKKAAELHHLGVHDFYIIQDAGELHWGISLGVFKTGDGARALLDALNKKGVHSAKIGVHNIGANKVAFQLRNLDAEAKAGLGKIMLDFPHTETRGCESDAAGDSKVLVNAAKDTVSHIAVH